MWCPYCDAEKQPRVWRCAQCGRSLSKPKKPEYQARGWEWIAALVCLVLLWLSLIQPGDPSELVTSTVLFLALAFAFSAARGEEGARRVLGVILVALWLTLAAFGGLFALMMRDWRAAGSCSLLPGYCVLVLLVEDIRWRLKVARM